MTAATFGDVTSGANLSPCGTYRYTLTRRWGAGDFLGWIMLNPSTADADVDDPTIRRCMRFARDWGFSGIRVANLFALRATNPKELLTHLDPVGPLNHLAIESMPETTVAAWGAHKMAFHQASLLPPRPLLCLGRTAAGAPRHPLYVRADAMAEAWP